MERSWCCSRFKVLSNWAEDIFVILGGILDFYDCNSGISWIFNMGDKIQLYIKIKVPPKNVFDLLPSRMIIFDMRKSHQSWAPYINSNGWIFSISQIIYLENILFQLKLLYIFHVFSTKKKPNILDFGLRIYVIMSERLVVLSEENEIFFQNSLLLIILITIRKIIVPRHNFDCVF